MSNSLKEAFKLVKQHPLMADVTKATVEVQSGVAVLFDQNGRERMRMPDSVYYELIGEFNE